MSFSLSVKVVLSIFFSLIKIKFRQFLVKFIRKPLSLKLLTSTKPTRNFARTAAQLGGRRELKAFAGAAAASGSQTSQNQPTTPPILNQNSWQNQLSIGLSRPKLQLKSQTKPPYTAGVAAACSCSQDHSHQIFAG